MSRIASQLRPNEKVLWQGNPVLKAFIFSSSIFPATIFGLFFFVVILVFFLPAMFYGGAPLFFLLPLLLFLLFPLAMIFGPIIWTFLAYKNTEYLISDQRLITQTGAIGLDTRFVDLEKIQEVYVRIGIFDRLFGTGSIMASTAGQVYIGMPQGAGCQGTGWGGAYGMRPSLSALKEPYEVQKLLQEAIGEVKQSKDQV